MIRFAIFLLISMILGCASKNGKDDPDQRYFYFTSEFPPDIYWNVVTHFKATSEKSSCNSMSINTGKVVPERVTESHSLRVSGDTVRVPLFPNASSSCGWELTGISLQDGGERCMRLHAIIIGDDKSGGKFSGKPILPDSLWYNCVLDSASGCYRCKEKIGDPILSFRMPVRPSNILFLKTDFRGPTNGEHF